VDRIAVDLTQTMTRLRARRLAQRFARDNSGGGDGGGGSFESARGCRRDTNLRFTCARLLVTYGDAGDSTRCRGIVVVVLRRDGARAYGKRNLHRCRQLARRSS
jgi:hypothetical protein